MLHRAILVTGATGFLGRNLCPYLVERGYRLRALVRPSSEVGLLESLGIELAWGDVCDAAAVRKAALGCGAVVHAAAKFRFWGEREEFFTANVAGTRNVLAAAQEAGVERFVHISTIAVVGAPPPGMVITEETPCAPQDAYQESKLAAEQLVLDACRQHHLAALILRPGAYYGPWGRYAFNRIFFEDPLRGLPMRIHGGQHVIFPVYIRDVARAIELALQRGRQGEIYNVCGRCLTHRQVNETVARLLEGRLRWWNAPAWGMILLARVWTWLARFTRREPFYPMGLYPYVFYDWPVSIDKAQQELGFQPTPFEEGARETLAWYREEGILDIDVKPCVSKDAL